MIYDWLEGETTISPEKAFTVGEALRIAGVSWTCGPLAVHAAGYLPWAIVALGLYSNMLSDASIAVEMLLNARDANATRLVDGLSVPPEPRECQSFADIQNGARARCEQLLTDSPEVHFVGPVFYHESSHRVLTTSFKVAYKIAMIDDMEDDEREFLSLLALARLTQFRGSLPMWMRVNEILDGISQRAEKGRKS